MGNANSFDRNGLKESYVRGSPPLPPNRVPSYPDAHVVRVHSPPTTVHQQPQPTKKVPNPPKQQEAAPPQQTSAIIPPAIETKEEAIATTLTPAPAPAPATHGTKRKNSVVALEKLPNKLKQGKWELTSFKNPEEQQSMIFPLKHIKDMWQSMDRVVGEMSSEQHPDFRKTHAGQVTLEALKDLYYLVHPGWQEVRDQIKVGLYKETEACGNTSVSMGLATAYFRKNPSKLWVVFINCGSGGTRFQIYTNFNKTISVAWEFKPDEGNGPGVLSFMRIEDEKKLPIYEPRKTVKTEAELVEEINQLMLKAPWLSEDIIPVLTHAFHGSVPPDVIREHIDNVDILAFVTGSIREKYYRLFADPAKQSKMNADVARVLTTAVNAKPFSQIFSPQGSVYFLSEEEEGRMELLGQRQMYHQINTRLKLLRGQNEEWETLVSLGIGQTSAQWASITRSESSDPKDFLVFAYPHGMNNANRLAGFGKALVAHYEGLRPNKVGSLDNLVAMIRQCLRLGRVPVIGLKSGASMYLISSVADELRRDLADEGASHQMTTATYQSRIRVFYSFAGEQRAAILNRNMSLSQVCAEAQSCFGTSKSFKSVMIHHKPLLSLLDVEADAVLEFSAFDKSLVWWPAEMTEGAPLCIRLPVRIINDFEQLSTPEQEFRHILAQYLAVPQEAQSYECVAHVTKLLWNKDIVALDQATSDKKAKIWLEMAEQWFREILATATSSKLNEFIALQAIPCHIRRTCQKTDNVPTSVFHSAQMECFPDESQTRLLTDHNIVVTTCPYTILPLKTGTPISDEHTIQTVLEAVKFTLQLADDVPVSLVSKTNVDGTAGHVAIVLQVGQDVGERRWYCIVLRAEEEHTVRAMSLMTSFLASNTISTNSEQNTWSSLSPDQFVRLLQEVTRDHPHINAIMGSGNGGPRRNCCMARIATEEDDQKQNTSKGQSEHTFLFQKLTEQLGPMSSVQYLMERNCFLTLFPLETSHVVIQVPCKSMQDDRPSEKFQEAVKSGMQRMDGIMLCDIFTTIKNVLYLRLAPEDEQHNKQACINIDDLSRVIQVLKKHGNVVTVGCEEHIRTEAMLDNACVATLVVRWFETPSDVPRFHRVCICVQSPFEPLCMLLRNHVFSPASCAYSQSILERARDYFPSSVQTVGSCLSQGPGDWVCFHRRAQILYDSFHRSMERATSMLQAKQHLPLEIKTNVKSERSLQRKLKGDIGEYGNQIVPLSCVEEKRSMIEKRWHEFQEAARQEREALLLQNQQFVASAAADAKSSGSSRDTRHNNNNAVDDDDERLRLSEEETDSSADAFSATMQFLHRLWNISTEEKWLQVRGKLRIGWIKETVDFGNTSVSMGAASRMEFKSSSEVLFLSCGTAGVKYQVFCKKPYLFMPEQRKGSHCNINSMICGEYVPPAEFGPEKSLHTMQEDLQKELAGLFHNNKAENKKRPIYAFVTGPIRDTWEKAADAGKQAMEGRMDKLFHVVNAQRLPLYKSWFITKQQEAELELAAVRTMYRNLQENKKLTDKVDVIACFGIGRTSSRWICEQREEADGKEKQETEEEEPISTFAASVGMDTPKTRGTSLEHDVVDPLLAHLLDNGKRNLDKLIALISTSSQPLIALKAGCTIFLQRNLVLREALFSPASFVYDYLRGTFYLEQESITPLLTQLREILLVLHEQVGPIVRIKDQSKLGFILINILFSHAVEDRSATTSQQTSKPQNGSKPQATSAGEHKNVSMICEVQIRVTGAPDDHVLYEIRRNLKPQARSISRNCVCVCWTRIGTRWFFSPKLLPTCLGELFSDACNFNFTPYHPRRKLTLYQDARENIRQAVS